MQVQSVRCNHCGAPLQVQEHARFVTCNYCKSELTIHRSESAITTEVLADISRKTDHIVDHLGVIRLQGDIDRLDREWQMKREELMVRDRRGKLQEPKARAGPLQSCALALLGIPVFIAIGAGGRDAAPLFIGLIIVAAIVSAVSTKTSPYKIAKADYEKKRAELQAKLDQAAPPR